MSSPDDYLARWRESTVYCVGCGEPGLRPMWGVDRWLCPACLKRDEGWARANRERQEAERLALVADEVNERGLMWAMHTPPA